jgi:Prealbumin-like fold domain
MVRDWKTRRLTRRYVVLFAALLGVVAFVAVASGTITPSTFNAADGNLVVNGSEKDWATPGLINCTSTPKVGCGLDLPTGQNDDSFTGPQANKEDSVPISIGTGSIPNNKSDLTRFYTANERVGTGATAKQFLYLAWERVQEPQGSTNMDFEFNQLSCEGTTQNPTPNVGGCSGNGVTPTRSENDLLITYDLAKGGVSPTLSFHKWILSGACENNGSNPPCWGAHQSLQSTTSEGAINDPTNNPSGSPAGSVVDPIAPDAPRTLSPRTFGEASINLTDSNIFPSGCTHFGSAFLKSRSSSEFSADLKDFIAPNPVNISNCGTIIIRKDAQPDDPQDFSFADTIPAPCAIGTLDDDGANGSSTPSSVTCNNVQASQYTVTETTATGWDLTNINCTDPTNNSSGNTATGVLTIDLAADETVDCTFVNKRQPQVKLQKTLDPASDTGTFNLDISQSNVSKASAANVGNGGVAPASGFVSVAPGSVTVSETQGNSGNIADYTKAISCDSSKGGNSGATSYSFTVAYGDQVTCTITNTRKPRIQLIKSLAPANDSGLFNLDISQSNVSKASATNVGNNGAAPASGFVTVDAGSVTVSETAGTNTSLADYAKSISCGAKGSNSGQTSLSITVANGDTVTCTITNTRRKFTIVAFVCETTGGTNALYQSTVAPLVNGVPGATTNTQSQLPSGVSADTLCALAANYPNLNSGTYNRQVVITP